MTIESSLCEKTCILKVKGNIDTFTSPELQKAVEENAPLCEKLTLDFAEVNYISSAGVRAVLRARKIIGGENLALKNLNKSVMEIFKMTGFLKVLNIG